MSGVGKCAVGIGLVVIALLIIYSVFFWTPGRESRKEEREEKKTKIKTPLAQIIVSGTAEKPYYEILWLDEKNKTFHIGYGSYNLSYVFQWLSEYFEVL